MNGKSPSRLSQTIGCSGKESATMSGKKSCLLFLFNIFDLLVIPSFAVAANSSHILYEIIPYIKVYENGTVERLSGTQTVPPSLDPSSIVLSKDVIIQPSPNISARLFLPNTAAAAGRKLPLLVYFHGGGFFTESAFSPTYHNFLSSVVAKANAVAVSVNYRLAPEHPLPIGYEDSLLALKWVFSHRGEGAGNETWLRRYVDFERVYVGGDSAGGNIAHNVMMRVGSGETGILVRGLFLNCPHFWGKDRIGNETSYPELVRLEETSWSHAYPNSSGFDDPASNPNLDPNLWKLGSRKVLVYVAENDVLRDRGLYYAKGLRKSRWGGVVKAVEVKGVAHVFNLNFPNTTKAKKMLNHVALFLNGRERLHCEKNRIFLLLSSE